MRLLPIVLTFAALCAAMPCVAQGLRPVEQQEVQWLQAQAARSGRQTVAPAFCQQEKLKASQWRMRAATLASPWKENLLASADKQDAAAAQCLQNSSGSAADAQYSLAQADRIKNHQPLLLPQRSKSVTDKYNRARKNLAEIIGVLRGSVQRMSVAVPRLQALAGKVIALGVHKGNAAGDIGPISQQDVSRALDALTQVRTALDRAEDSNERLNYQFADKFSADAYLEDPRSVVFDISTPYTNALDATELEWVMLGNEIAWRMWMAQLDVNGWAGQHVASAAAEGDAFEHQRGIALTAANANPGNPNAVLGNRKGPEALLRFEVATQTGIDAYCGKYQKAAASEALALAPKVQALAGLLIAQRNLLTGIRTRLAADLAYPPEGNRNGRTPLNYPDHAFSTAWYTNWPAGLRYDVAVPGKGHPTYYVATRIGFIRCPDWRDQMPKDIAVRFPGVVPVFTEDGTTSLNINLINPLVLEGEAEGRAPEQQL